MHSTKVLLGLALLGVCALSGANASADPKRDGKLLNIFQVVRFPNEACNTTANDQGVCYTEAECKARDGTNAGSCASGFGVCCSFSVKCGATTNQNNTYFTSTDTDTSPCTVKICPCNDDICQIRLDFETFNIAQPQAPAAPSTNSNAGTTCQGAQFTATSSSTTVPVICGLNSGSHIFLGAEQACNALNFAWQNANPRQWRIKVSQLECTNPARAPEGCLQEITGATGFIMSFNFAGGRHLANQEQTICVRKVANACRIDYSHIAGQNTFGLGKLSSLTMNRKKNLGDYCTEDYLVIPQGFADIAAISQEKYCGNMLVRNPLATVFGGPVSSLVVPFQVTFVTDAGEGGGLDSTGATGGDNYSTGFKLAYEQKTTGC